MKKSMYSLLSLVAFGMLILSCGSKEAAEKEAKRKQDSVAAAAAEKQPITVNPNTPFSITPPDADYTGDYIDKYPNGVIKFVGNFRFGVRHGHWMSFYDTGIKWSECYYDKGKKHGETIVYFPNGNVQYKGWYKNDMRDSLWLYYDEKGKEIDKHAFREDEETGLVN